MGAWESYRGVPTELQAMSSTEYILANLTLTLPCVPVPVPVPDCNTLTLQATQQWAQGFFALCCCLRGSGTDWTGP